MVRFRQLTKFLASGLVCLLSGCCAHCGGILCDGCADIPPGAIPQPAGTHACAWQTTQDALAERDDFVIYQYEWIGESEELGPFGRRHVAGLISRLESQPHSIVVQPSDNPSLDLQRRAALIALLEDRGVPDAPSRVRMGFGLAEGLHGQEAPQLEQGYLRGGSRSGGVGGGSGGSAFGGTGAFGGGGRGF